MALQNVSNPTGAGEADRDKGAEAGTTRTTVNQQLDHLIRHCLTHHPETTHLVDAGRVVVDVEVAEEATATGEAAEVERDLEAGQYWVGLMSLLEIVLMCYSQYQIRTQILPQTI